MKLSIFFFGAAFAQYAQDTGYDTGATGAYGAYGDSGSYGQQPQVSNQQPQEWFIDMVHFNIMKLVSKIFLSRFQNVQIEFIMQMRSRLSWNPNFS